jgi:hypothetical protein
MRLSRWVGERVDMGAAIAALVGGALWLIGCAIWDVEVEGREARKLFARAIAGDEEATRLALGVDSIIAGIITCQDEAELEAYMRSARLLALPQAEHNRCYTKQPGPAVISVRGHDLGKYLREHNCPSATKSPPSLSGFQCGLGAWSRRPYRISRQHGNAYPAHVRFY